MSDRRRYERHPIEVPVNVSTRERRDRAGMIRDVSASGLLFHSASHFELGERVTVMFRVARRKDITAGSVVRTLPQPNAENGFRFLTAVQFDAPLLDLPLT